MQLRKLTKINHQCPTDLSTKSMVIFYHHRYHIMNNFDSKTCIRIGKINSQLTRSQIIICSAYLTSSALLVGSTGGELVVFSALTLNKLGSLKIHENAIIGIGSPESHEYAVTAGRDNKIVLTKGFWPKDTQVLALIDSGLLSFSFSPITCCFAYVTKDSYLITHNIKTTLRYEYEMRLKVSSVTISNLSHFAAMIGENSGLLFTETSLNGKIRHVVKKDCVIHTVFTSDDTYLFLSTLQGDLIKLCCKTLEIVKRSKIFSSQINQFSLGSNFIYVISREFIKKVNFDLKIQQISTYFKPKIVLVTQDQRALIVIENWNLIKLIDINTKIQLKAWAEPGQAICTVEKNDFYITASKDYLVRVWNICKNELFYVFSHYKATMKSLSLKGTILIAKNTNKEFHIVDLSNNKVQKKLSIKYILVLLNRKKSILA